MLPELRSKLRPDLDVASIKETHGIPILLNPRYLDGDNARYMKMYDRMSPGYDVAETLIGKLKGYSTQIAALRGELMRQLEWRDDASVLYVSIGTGKDLQFIPPGIDKSTLRIFGADISLGMLRKCQRKHGPKSGAKLNLSLVNCCAEDLPFRDNAFDIVFHVGGINFFNDRPRALAEMLRVAKPGTKLLVADETADYIETQYKRSTLTKKHFAGKIFALDTLKKEIPATVRDLQTTLLWDGRFYCITFRK